MSLELSLDTFIDSYVYLKHTYDMNIAISNCMDSFPL